MVEVSGVQAAEESTYIDSSSVETNMQNLDVYVTDSTVRLRQESSLCAEIPLHMIIGGALTKSAILEKLNEGNILVVHKNENGNIALFVKRNEQSSNAIHLGTYEQLSCGRVTFAPGGCVEPKPCCAN